MPKYKLPPLPKAKKGEERVPEVVEGDMCWARKVSFPANKELIRAVQVGDEVLVTLKGKLIESSLRESEAQKERANLEVEVSEVEVYSEGEFEKLDREADESEY